jgi:hypothetical protein
VFQRRACSGSAEVRLPLNVVITSNAGEVANRDFAIVATSVDIRIAMRAFSFVQEVQGEIVYR